MLVNIIIDNGVTVAGFSRSNKEDFEDLGLTKFGKKLILRILSEINLKVVTS